MEVLLLLLAAGELRRAAVCSATRSDRGQATRHLTLLHAGVLVSRRGSGAYVTYRLTGRGLEVLRLAEALFH